MLRANKGRHDFDDFVLRQYFIVVADVGTYCKLSRNQESREIWHAYDDYLSSGVVRLMKMGCQRCQRCIFESLFRCVTHHTDGGEAFRKSCLLYTRLRGVLANSVDEKLWLNWGSGLQKKNFSRSAKFSTLLLCAPIHHIERPSEHFGRAVSSLASANH